MQRTSKFEDNKYVVTYTVEEENHNSRIDSFLSIHFTSFSRERLKKMIAAKNVEIIGRDHKIKSSTKVKKGEIIQITTHKKDLPNEVFNGVEIEEEELQVIKQTDDYIVINKPPFMAAHPTGKHLFYAATVLIENNFNFKVSTVHRLDRETSGVMILSKNSKFAQRANDLFENRLVKKAYFFIAHEKQKKDFPFLAEEELGFIENFKPELYTHCFDKGSAKGKVSFTKFEKIVSKNAYLLGLAFPKTGRQHQIRAHAAHHGYPLLGDKLYNGDPNVFSRFKDLEETSEDIGLMQIPRHALHAISLKLPEPVNETFVASIPKDLSKWIEENLSLNISELESKLAEIIKREL